MLQVFDGMIRQTDVVKEYGSENSTTVMSVLHNCVLCLN